MAGWTAHGPPDRLRQAYGESAEALCEGGRRTLRGVEADATGSQV